MKGLQVAMATSALFLRDVLDIKEDVHAGDFKVELSGGFDEAAARVDEYVVTEQLQSAFRQALGLVKACVAGGKSEAAYLHGSFGSGKSHFMTVLHAVLQGAPAARRKPRLQEVVAEHDMWLRGKRFLMVPYHLVGSTDLDSAILGGYVATVRRLHPDAPVPAVYRSDALLRDARRQRGLLRDDAQVAQWLGAAAEPGPVADSGELDDLDDLDAAAVGGWTLATFDAALDAPVGDPRREALVSALLSGPMSSFAAGMRGAADAFLPLENGLAVISRHARSLGYSGLILFLDELILWLQAHMSNQEKVNTEVSKLVKLVESADSDRPVPIVSFISRQRNLSQLIGADVTGADVKNLEAQVEYLAGRFTVINLEDTNLPAIIKERVLRPKDDAGRSALDAAFAVVESNNAAVRDVLLDAHGATQADWADFRSVYPISPALLNVLVALSGALQRERTGLKLLHEMLRQRRDDLRLGELIPIGDLWDVLCDGIGEAFTDRLRKESEAATRFHAKVRAELLRKYGSVDDPRYKADDRVVKTLILKALAPEVPALGHLTGGRLAALNLGSFRSRAVPPGRVVVDRLGELIGAGFGQIRSDGQADPVFTLHLSDLDLDPILDQVGEQDGLGARRIWLKDHLWSKLGIKDSGPFVCEREIVWRGTRRTAEFVFENVRDDAVLPDAQFQPSRDGVIRFILAYPFDVPDKYPSDAVGRLQKLAQDWSAAQHPDTLVWLPDHFSDQASQQLGRLIKIRYLLERNRLDDYTAHLAADDRVAVRHQLKAQADSLSAQLEVILRQMYGIAGGNENNVKAEVPDGQHVYSLNPALRRPELYAGLGFEENMLKLADVMFAAKYPRHPDFDTAGARKPVTTGELKNALAWITRAMNDPMRRVVVDSGRLKELRKIVHPLELGEVGDGPLVVGSDWKLRIEQQAAKHRAAHGEYAVEEVRGWVAELGWTGLDKNTGNLVIATYALLSDRAWVYHGTPVAEPPELEKIGSGWFLRAQPMPTEEEFAAASGRAAKIFGVAVPQVLLARNVTKLASEVRAKAQAAEQAVAGVRRSLERHGQALGISGPDAPRPASGRQAADLLARLTAAHDATPLVRELAAASYHATDEALAAAIASAPAVLAALDSTDWPLLESVRGLVGRGDSLADRAERLFGEIAETANDEEFSRALAPVLGEAKDRVVALLSDATRLSGPPAQAAPAPAATAGPAVPAQRTSGADAISLTFLGTPPVPSAPEPPPARATPSASQAPAASSPRSRRVSALQPSRLEQQLSDAIAGVREEIRAYAKRHPGAEVEIAWRPLDVAAQGGEQ
jgi:hypothetical protein